MKDIQRGYELGDINDVQVAAASIIPAGVAVGLADGYATVLSGGALFLGFALTRADNQWGAAGAQVVRVRTRGQARVTLPGVSASDLLAPVYATGPDAFALAETNASLIGFVARVAGADSAIVEFEASPLYLRQALLSGGVIGDLVAQLGLGSAAFLPSEHFATAEQGDLAETVAAWGDHRSIGYAVIDEQGRLPPVSGALLTGLPNAYAVYADAALAVSSSTTSTAMAEVTVPGGVANQLGSAVRIVLSGTYLNNSGSSAGFTLKIQAGAATLYEDLFDAMPTAAGGRPVLIEVELIRAGDLLARLEGSILVGNAGAATVGTGDGGFNGIRANIVASGPGGGAGFTYDWAAPAAITVSIALSSAAATHTFTRTAMRGYSDRYDIGAAVPPPVVPEDTRAYLEDRPTKPTTTRAYAVPLADISDYPIKASSTLLQNPGAAGLGQMDYIAWKPFAPNIAAVAAAQAIRPITYARIIAGPAYQGFDEAAGAILSGHNFDGTGPTSGPGVVYAGHWLYLGGTTSVTAITATATTISVNPTQYITAGKYCVIYGPGWGTFTDAEHVLVESVTLNTGTGKYDLRIVRGYKSTARAHPANSCVSQHAQGNGTRAELWRYHLGPDCPLDGAAKRWNQYFAEWIAAYYDAASYTTLLACTVHAVCFDSDFPCDAWGSATGSPWADRAIDQDNNGVADWGLNRTTGENRWRIGWNQLYQQCRDALDARGRVHVMLQPGESSAAGQGIANDRQKEAAASGQMSETGSAVAKPTELDRYVSAVLSDQGSQTATPSLGEWMEKIGTRSYPPPGGGAKDDNWARLTFAVACVFSEMYSWHNWSGADADRYYEFECVDLTAGADYGKAIIKTNAVGRRTWKNWLGAPTADYRRIYSYAAMAPENAIFHAGFETGITGWSAANGVLTRSTTEAIEGTGSLKIVINAALPAWPSDSACRVTGPSVTLAANTEYSLALSLKCNRHGRIRPMFGALQCAGLYPTLDQWARRIWTFRTTSAITTPLLLDVGSFGVGDLFVDAIYLFAGNVDVFLRTFEHGIVVVNATPTAKTVALGGTYQRVRGWGQDPANDGSSATSVTIAPYGAYIGVTPAA